MAAVLGRACCKPCELITKCLGKMCEGCSKACQGCCDGFSRFVNTYFSRPFSCLLLFAFLFTGIPAVAMVIITVGSHGDDTCKPDGGSSIRMWNYVMAVLYVLTTFVTTYAFCRFSKPYTNDPKDRNFVARFQHLICEDVVIAFYILVICFKFVWLILGGIWLGSALNCDGTSLQRVTNAAITFGIVYFCVAGVMIFYNFVYFTCCPQSANRQYGSHNPQQQQQQQQQQQPPPQAHYVGHTPVATATPVAAAPQVVVHGTIAESNPPQPQTSTVAENLARNLIGNAKALFSNPSNNTRRSSR